MKLLLSLMVVLLFTSQSCEDDHKPKTELEKLPPATQEGKNTFGCLVNGKAWVIEVSTDVQSFYQEGVLSIGASITNQGIGLTLRTPTLSETTFTLDSAIDHFAQFGNQTLSCLFVTDEIYTGVLTINHFDQVNFIISGTFEFEAYSIDCDKVVKITHGRFDLTYAP